MNKKQEHKFKSLCNQMRELLSEMEEEHPDIQVFIEDGTVYLMDWPLDEVYPQKCILTDGGVWPRSGGGGF